MVANPDKVRENKARRQATRLGCELRKSRIRNWNIDNQGGYMLVDIDTNSVIMGSRFECSLSEIENYLKKTEKEWNKRIEEKQK